MFLNSQIEYLLWLQNLRTTTNDILDPFFLGVTHFGEFLIPIAFLSLIYWSLNKKAGEFLIITHAFSLLLNQFVKMAACINRPWILSDKIKPVADAIPRATGYSFPSGHTANAMAVWGGLAVWLWDNKKVRYSMLVLILLIAFSRNYLGVHTPQDIIVSFILGIIILFISKKTFDKIANGGVDKKIFLTGFILSVAVIAFVIIKYYSLNGQKFFDFVYQMPSFYFNTGYTLGAVSGWFCCRKLIPFETDNLSWLKRITRFIFGYCAFLIILFQGLPILISDFGSCKGNFICALFIGIFITFFYPWIFTRLEKYLNFKGIDSLWKKN